jgi:hypothetical protein
VTKPRETDLHGRGIVGTGDGLDRRNLEDGSAGERRVGDERVTVAVGVRPEFALWK